MLQIVKRLQILIDEDLDAELERLSSTEGRSKASLIREFVRKQVKPLPPLEADPLWGMVGRDSFGPIDPREIDDIVYGDSSTSSSHGAARQDTRRKRRRDVK